MSENSYNNIFITVAGSTPQILTETLFDLMVQRGFNISELVIITTQYGKEIFEKSLFDNENGHFYQFCTEFGIKAYTMNIRFVVIKNKQGQPLNDIRNEDDNRAAANCIVNTVREYTNDQNNRIFASIAGGRKTMSTYMGLAMRLYARKQDKLFHVLVAPQELESNPFFYFPPKDSRDLTLKNKNGQEITIPYQQIQISNAEIPFIRLREILPFVHGPQAMEYEDLLELTQKEISEAFVPVLRIEPKKSLAIVKWRDQTWQLKFKPMDFAFYWYMLKKRSIVNSNDNPHSRSLLKLYLKIRPDVDKDDKTLLPAFRYQDLIDSRSRINRIIKEKISFDKIHQFLIIKTQQNNRVPTYSIDLPNATSVDYLSLI